MRAELLGEKEQVNQVEGCSANVTSAGQSMTTHLEKVVTLRKFESVEDDVSDHTKEFEDMEGYVGEGIEDEQIWIRTYVGDECSSGEEGG